MWVGREMRYNGRYHCHLTLLNISSTIFPISCPNTYISNLQSPPGPAGELVVKEHASKFGRTASSWPKAALASLRRRHEHLVFLVHQV